MPQKAYFKFAEKHLLEAFLNVIKNSQGPVPLIYVMLGAFLKIQKLRATYTAQKPLIYLSVV